LKPPPRFYGPLPFYKLYLFESSASEEYGRTSHPTDPPKVETERLTPHSTSQTENGESYAPWQRPIWSYELPKLGISTFPIYFDQALVWHVLAHFAGKICFQYLSRNRGTKKCSFNKTSQVLYTCVQVAVFH